MISAYKDWDTRKNWYALLIVICTNKSIGRALLDMGIREPNKVTSTKQRNHYQKYTDAQMSQAMHLREVEGMKWHDIADATGINYGSLMSIYTRKKKKGLTLVDRKGGKR